MENGEKDNKKIENVQIIIIINLMGWNPILKLDVNIFWSFSKYVLKMITINSDMWSKYPDSDVYALLKRLFKLEYFL